MDRPRILEWKEAGARPPPARIWAAPPSLRFALAAVGLSAAILVSVAISAALQRWVTGEVGAAVFGVMLATFFGYHAFRYFNPWNPYRWFHFALADDGLYLPTRDRRIVLVPWSRVSRIDIERWSVKGDHSMARVRLDLDDAIWHLFEPGLVEDGADRRYRIQVEGIDADTIASEVAAFRDRAADA